MTLRSYEERLPDDEGHRALLEQLRAHLRYLWALLAALNDSDTPGIEVGDSVRPPGSYISRGSIRHFLV
jgi:hypothetical protein